MRRQWPRQRFDEPARTPCVDSHRRCLVPAYGYSEWTPTEDGGKDPWPLQLPSGKPFAFAGLWFCTPGKRCFYSACDRSFRYRPIRMAAG